MTFTMRQWFGGSWADIPVDGVTHPVGSPFLMSNYAWNFNRVWRFTLTGALDAFVRLPDATTMPVGAEVFFMQQKTASGHLVVLQDNDGVRVGSIGPIASGDARGTVHLLDNLTAAGVWVVTAHRTSGIEVMA